MINATQKKKKVAVLMAKGIIQKTKNKMKLKIRRNLFPTLIQPNLKVDIQKMVKSLKIVQRQNQSALFYLVVMKI